MLIEYIVGDSIIYAVCIQNNAAKLHKLKVNQEEFKQRITKFNQVINDFNFITDNKASSYKTYTENANWLYQKLLEPIINTNVDIKNLVIIPDGYLGHLPFETFLYTKDISDHIQYNNLPYLINRYNISYDYSATHWLKNRQKPSSGNTQILAMAAHYLGWQSNKLANQMLEPSERVRKGLNPLPLAKKEVQILATYFEGYFGFDSLATERNFKDKVNDYGIIHLAMHGTLHAESPLLSNLAFTDDGDSIENNFLHAYEITKLELNTDLVVLSACETGMGRYEKGNGFASLARSFMYAGAKSLVVSLWEIDDQATAGIMPLFYKNLQQGMTKPMALRYAKLNYLKEANGIYAHPIFWAPFIQLGNDQPIQIQAKTGGFQWWSIGLMISFIAIAVVVSWFYQKQSC